MKLKFRAEPEDLLIFLLFAIFLLFVVAIGVVNINSFAATGKLAGINPFPAFGPNLITATLLFYFLLLLGIMLSVNSMFFERSEGIGFSLRKDSKGYSRWAKEREIKEELTKVSLSVKNSKAAGVPLIIKKNEMWVDDSEYHSLVIGATGSGKTQAIIHPTVHSLCKARESMIITDPKGEIYEGNAEMLRRRGYQILILNFRDPQNGNAWNPMSIPYKLYKSGNHDKAIELLDDLALNILYDESNKNADPFWEKTSADYFSGVALGLFEDAKEDEININSISLATTVGEEKFGNSTYIKEYFSMKDPASAAAINASSTIMAPNETKGSILSVFKQKVKLFASRDNLSEMLSHSDIDLETIGERPTAVFIVIQDEKKTYHSLVTILLKQIYETLISTAQRHGGKLPVRTNFLLDEFANMPPLKDVTTMITAARSRKIRFTMIIQNFAQLDSVYGKDDAETIRGNCGNIIYLITTELKALEEISKMCGEEKSKKEDKTASTPLVTVSDLQRMKQYEVIILRMRKQPFKTKFIPNYKLDWGIKYPIAKYPTRAKKEVHTFDIKEFVKNQKKKKLLEMMNAADENDKKIGLSNELAPVNLPFDLQEMRERRNNRDVTIPDFMRRKPLGMGSIEDKTPPRKENNPFPVEPNHYNEFPPLQDSHMTPKLDDSNDTDVDDLGFDVDELVRKIDAKIAELEEEEKKNKEEEKKNKEEAEKAASSMESEETAAEEEEKITETKETQEIPIPTTAPTTPTIKPTSTSLYSMNDDDDDDDDFFDDFFDN